MLSLCEVEFPVIKVYASDLLGLFSVIEFLAPHKKVRHCYMNENLFVSDSFLKRKFPFKFTTKKNSGGMKMRAVYSVWLWVLLKSKNKTWEESCMCMCWEWECPFVNDLAFFLGCEYFILNSDELHELLNKSSAILWNATSQNTDMLDIFFLSSH